MGSCASHWDMCSVTAIFAQFGAVFAAAVPFPMAVADLKKRLETLERSQQLIAQLALATDRDVRQEKTRHELIVHLRGEAVEEMQRLFDEHVKSKESLSNDRAKKSRNSAGDDPAANALADTAARNSSAAQTLRVKFWGWLMQFLKARASAAEEAGRAQLVVAAAAKLHSYDGQVVLHSCRFHSREPLESEAMEKVWHLSLDFAFSGDGIMALQLLAYDLQPFSYQDVTFHRASSRPGTLAKKVADLCEHSRSRRS